MSIITSAALVVGKAVAKSLFKLWTKDVALGEDISSDLLDLVEAKTSDVIAQRKGNRQFEEIGDKIGENMLPLLEREGIALDEGERKAVAFAVADTLNKTRITLDILLQQNLQPTTLEKQVLATRPDATRDFSTSGTSLYHLLVKESCTYIVDLSSHLPSFTEHTFAEILKRDDLIRVKIDHMLEEMRRLQTSLDPSDFERKYREAVKRKLDILQLIGADVSLAHRHHQLSVAYITLSVSHKQTSSPFPLLDQEKEHKEEEMSGSILPVDVALASADRLLIYGEAGSGKTTLMQWIAVQAAKKTFEGQLADWNGCVPFYIRLRHYAQTNLPRPEAFPEFAASAIIGEMPSNWVHTILHSGRALLLIDGVDELSRTQRDDVYIWLKELIATYPACRFLVTSRPYGIEEGWMHHETFQELTLQEMTLSDIHLFIDHWHAAVKQEVLTREEQDEFDSLAEHLKTHIRQTRAIRNLATNPLLCAMLCALNRERRRQLPLNRIELYIACCSLLLERREKESHIDLSDYPPLQYSQKERLLTDLAYWMTRENLSEVEATRVDERFAGRLALMTNSTPDIRSTAVRLLFVQRAGMLREPVQGCVDFTHKTFQEFFAAQGVLATNDIEYLIHNAHLQQWREVIILATGLAKQQACEQLISGLLQRGDQEPEQRHQLHLLAVACLETAIEIDPAIRAELEKRLSQLVPPKNMTEAKTLAAAGELAVKHLHKKKLEKKRKLIGIHCAACIRTLSLIGGELALDALEGYAADGRDEVVNELAKSWDMFDRQLYAQRILLQTLRNTSFLLLERVSSLEGLECFPALTWLSLFRCKQITDVSPLASLTALTHLTLFDCKQITDVSPLASLTALTTLHLSWCSQVTDASPLASLTALTTLNLSGCDHITDLSPLASLTDVSPLASLTALTWLNLSECKQLTDVSPLASLTALTSLDLSGCNQLTDVSPLASLTALTSLDLSGCNQITDLSLLANLRSHITR